MLTTLKCGPSFLTPRVHPRLGKINPCNVTHFLNHGTLGNGSSQFKSHTLLSHLSPFYQDFFALTKPTKEVKPHPYCSMTSYGFVICMSQELIWVLTTCRLNSHPPLQLCFCHIIWSRSHLQHANFSTHLKVGLPSMQGCTLLSHA